MIVKHRKELRIDRQRKQYIDAMSDATANVLRKQGIGGSQYLNDSGREGITTSSSSSRKRGRDEDELNYKGNKRRKSKCSCNLR